MGIVGKKHSTMKDLIIVLVFVTSTQIESKVWPDSNSYNQVLPSLPYVSISGTQPVPAVPTDELFVPPTYNSPNMVPPLPNMPNLPNLPNLALSNIQRPSYNSEPSTDTKVA